MQCKIFQQCAFKSVEKIRSLMTNAQSHKKNRCPDFLQQLTPLAAISSEPSEGICVVMLYLGIVLDSSLFDRISVSVTSWTANCYIAYAKEVTLNLPMIWCVIRFCHFKAKGLR